MYHWRIDLGVLFLNELSHFKFCSGIFIFVVLFVCLFVDFLAAGGGEEKETSLKNIWKISEAK